MMLNTALALRILSTLVLCAAANYLVFEFMANIVENNNDPEQSLLDAVLLVLKMIPLALLATLASLVTALAVILLAIRDYDRGHHRTPLRHPGVHLDPQDSGRATQPPPETTRVHTITTPPMDAPRTPNLPEGHTMDAIINHTPGPWLPRQLTPNRPDTAEETASGLGWTVGRSAPTPAPRTVRQGSRRLAHSRLPGAAGRRRAAPNPRPSALRQPLQPRPHHHPDPSGEGNPKGQAYGRRPSPTPAHRTEQPVHHLSNSKRPVLPDHRNPRFQKSTRQVSQAFARSGAGTQFEERARLSQRSPVAYPAPSHSWSRFKYIQQRLRSVGRWSPSPK